MQTLKRIFSSSYSNSFIQLSPEESEKFEKLNKEIAKLPSHFFVECFSRHPDGLTAFNTLKNRFGASFVKLNYAADSSFCNVAKKMENLILECFIFPNHQGKKYAEWRTSPSREPIPASFPRLQALSYLAPFDDLRKYFDQLLREDSSELIPFFPVFPFNENKYSSLTIQECSVILKRMRQEKAPSKKDYSLIFLCRYLWATHRKFRQDLDEERQANTSFERLQKKIEKFFLSEGDKEEIFSFFQRHLFLEFVRLFKEDNKKKLEASFYLRFSELLLQKVSEPRLLRALNYCLFLTYNNKVIENEKMLFSTKKSFPKLIEKCFFLELQKYTAQPSPKDQFLLSVLPVSKKGRIPKKNRRPYDAHLASFLDYLNVRSEDQRIQSQLRGFKSLFRDLL